MSSASTELDPVASPTAVLRRLRRGPGVAVLLDGRGGFAGGWRHGPRLATRTGPAREFSRSRLEQGLRFLDRRVRERRTGAASPDRGMVAVVSYDPRAGSRLPALVLVEVEASLELGDSPPGAGTTRRSLPTRRVAATSLPRDRYLRAVERIQRHIRAGDVYQANLTQRFTVEEGADPLTLYERLVARNPAPRSAYVEGRGWALLSASPETFLTVDRDGRIETRPIKGTRARGREEGEDRAAAAELLASAKDRAELTMITDLERNDLGRICETGSVHVPQLIGLETFPEVHHLVSRVVGQLRPDVGPAELLAAMFPGGSISGAPKVRAIEILREVEPVERSFYTGSLFWFGDDGFTDSSILIRSIVLEGGSAHVGAGGGIVADSDPEAEWLESNHKARALGEVLGFAPEEAR